MRRPLRKDFVAGLDLVNLLGRGAKKGRHLTRCDEAPLLGILAVGAAIDAEGLVRRVVEPLGPEANAQGCCSRAKGGIITVSFERDDLVAPAILLSFVA
jgi:hypothetical protein